MKHEWFNFEFRNELWLKSFRRLFIAGMLGFDIDADGYTANQINVISNGMKVVLKIWAQSVC
jgi:hypothetical protein